MDVQEYERRLQDLERSLSNRIAQEHAAARAQVLDMPGDVGDVSVSDEGAQPFG
jgi:hypothetical protein